MSKAKPVYCFETETVYNGCREAANTLKINEQCVRKCCLEDLIQTEGFHFCYNEDRSVYEIRFSKREKPIIAYNLNTNEITKYHSAKEASVELKIPQETICRILKGKTKKPRIGYLFKYDVQRRN